MAKYLIVNSDDFGISEDVSRGIIEAHLQGIVTSTTAMVNMPAAEAAIKKAQSTAPNLGIGLHLTLSYGSPVSEAETIPSLVTEEGSFVSTYGALMEKMPGYRAEDLERELNAQFERFCEIAGHKPDHIDSHHRAAYMHPAGLDIMLRLAHTHNLPLRWAGIAEESYGLDAQTVKLLHETVDRHGKPRHCDHTMNVVFDFKSSPRLERAQIGLRTIQEGYTEFIVHVGYGENLAEDYNFQRNEELAAVTDPSLKVLLEEEGIQPINFGDLP